MDDNRDIFAKVRAENDRVTIWFRAADSATLNQALLNGNKRVVERIAPVVDAGSLILTGHTFLKCSNGPGVPEIMFRSIMEATMAENADVIGNLCQSLGELVVELNKQGIRPREEGEPLLPHQLVMEVKASWKGEISPATATVLLQSRVDSISLAGCHHVSLTKTKEDQLPALLAHFKKELRG